MKKQILFASAVLFVLGAVTFSGCKKDDTTPPVITLNGSSSMSQSLNSSFTDPGATANDDEDGEVTVSVTGTVDPNMKALYTLTYTATDAAGNSGTATRTVDIVNDAEYLAGAYANSTDSCTITGGPFLWASPNFPDVITSNTVNNAITINNFGQFGESININATVSGTNITIPLGQSLGGTYTITAIYTTAPNATGITSTTAPTSFTIKYQWNDGTGSDVCVSKYIR